jgi:hypothetical protein
MVCVRLRLVMTKRAIFASNSRPCVRSTFGRCVWCVRSPESAEIPSAFGLSLVCVLNPHTPYRRFTPYGAENAHWIAA